MIYTNMRESVPGHRIAWVIMERPTDGRLFYVHLSKVDEHIDEGWEPIELAWIEQTTVGDHTATSSDEDTEV